MAHHTHHLAELSLDALRARGAVARRLGLPYFANPFYRNTTIEHDAWVSKCMAWTTGWLEEDAGRTAGIHAMLGLKLW